MKASGDCGVAEVTTAPLFEYFLETLSQPVAPEHPAWLRLLPMSRHGLAEPAPSGLRHDASICVRDYFQGIREFIQGSGRNAFISSLAKWGADASAAETVRIFLAKHGEYYHPARVETEIKGVVFRWVVNVAVSTAGMSLLFKEFGLLEKLGREFSASYVPEVYGAGEVDTGRGRMLAMFIGQWLADFHEFHLTRGTLGGGQALVLWDPQNGPRYLDTRQAYAVYHQVARILTHYLKLKDFAGIGAWHHAAGDFVVRLKEDRPEVRLITVREYLPLFLTRPVSVDSVRSIKLFLEALLIFLLNLSIRTRLDRLDGTGDLAWSEPVAVQATVAGMLDSLAEKAEPFELPLPMELLFRRFLAACSKEDLLSLCRAIVEKNYAPGSLELSLLETCLEEHAAELTAVFSRL